MGFSNNLKDKSNTEFSIHHNISTTWTMNEFHFHDSFEINLSLSGGNNFFVNDKIYTVKRGDLFVFNNRDLHKTVVPKDIIYERYLIFFNPEYIHAFCTPTTDLLACFAKNKKSPQHMLHLDDSQLAHITALFNRAIAINKKLGYGSDINKKMILVEILIFINLLYKSPNNLPEPVKDENYKKIEPILSYIQNNLDKRILLEDISSNFYISKYHLCTIFKKATGFTVNEYIIKKRIMKARDLLKQNLPVSEVGELVGFPNDAHFIRTFKKLMGTTPKQYAKKHRYTRFVD